MSKEVQPAAKTTITRDVQHIEDVTGNVYKSLVILSKRSNQIGQEIKHELHEKLEEFAVVNDNLEEIFENREQIEISKHYERAPKSTALAITEFLSGGAYYRTPEPEPEKVEVIPNRED